MRYLLLLLAIPFISVATAAPDCTKLQQIANDLEKAIQNKRFSADECDKITPESLNLPAGSIGFSGEYDYRCKDLSALETQLKSIENEIALLKGIDSLKVEIDSGLKTISKAKNPNIVKEASVSFIKNLNVATSLEAFLATNNAKSENILSKVVEDKAGWTDLNSFAGLLRKHCGSFSSSPETVCRKGFELNQDTFKEINDFVTIGQGTERKFNKHQIKDLTLALGMKKGEEKYTFAELAKEIKGIQADGVLSAEDIATIQEMPALSNRTSHDFLKNLKASINDIKGSDELIKAQSVPTRFSSIINDLKKRQEWEMKSKFSLVLHQYSEFMSPQEVTDCDAARELKGDIEKCLLPLKTNKNLKSYEQAAVGDLISEFKYGKEQLTRLDDSLRDCIPDASMVYPAKCNDIISNQMADLVAKSQALNALKAKHIQASPDLFTFRNFALEKLHSGECMTAGESNLPECNIDFGNISREAITLSGAASDIIYVYEKPKEDTVIEQLCLSSEEKVPYKSALCALKDDDPEKRSNKKYGDNFDAPVSPDTGDPTGKALIDLGSSILNSVAGYLAPPKPPMVNPYNSIFPYVVPTAQPRDIKNQIMDPYVASGFGNYSPTPGLMPYSSVSSNVGIASAYNFSGGSHFNSPVGI